MRPNHGPAAFDGIQEADEVLVPAVPPVL